MSGARRSGSPVTTVVKLGGSIITDKAVEFSYRESAVRSLGRELARSGERVVLVHGGGSFGHPLAKRYGLSSTKTKRSPEGVAETRAAMLELDLKVCSSLRSAGVTPYTFTPYPLLRSAGRTGLGWLRALLDSGVVPTTFGDVISAREGFVVISGDTIARELARSLSATRCIFVMDVDGILGPGGAVMPTVERSSLASIKRTTTRDATGGVLGKVEEALRIASGGTEVAFVSGFRPEEFAKALKRQPFHGTVVRVPSHD